MYTTSELVALIRDAARRYGIDPDVAVAQLSRESVGFRPHYVYGPGKSPAGAMGLAQFMPGTWAIYGKGSPYDPAAALEAWGRYMSHLLSLFGGRYDLALAGYNWGENRATLRKAMTAGNPILAYSIPSETRNYVKAILDAAPSPVIDIQSPDALTPYAPPMTDSFGSGWLDLPDLPAAASFEFSTVPLPVAIGAVLVISLILVWD